jgi:hypothetical protein
MAYPRMLLALNLGVFLFGEVYVLRLNGWVARNPTSSLPAVNPKIMISLPKRFAVRQLSDGHA